MKKTNCLVLAFMFDLFLSLTRQTNSTVFLIYMAFFEQCQCYPHRMLPLTKHLCLMSFFFVTDFSVFETANNPSLQSLQKLIHPQSIDLIFLPAAEKKRFIELRPNHISQLRTLKISEVMSSTLAVFFSPCLNEKQPVLKRTLCFKQLNDFEKSLVSSTEQSF